MTTEWNNLWTFKTKRFTTTLDWAWEDDQDLSWDETGETIAKLESGEWGNYTFRLKVALDGREIAADYLGNSIYADPKEFYQEHLGIAAKSRADGRNYGSYFSDMVREGIGEARKALRDVPKLRGAGIDLSKYTTPEDWGLSHKAALRMVADRIIEDIAQ